MNKVELIDAIAKRTGLTKQEAAAGMNAMVSLITGALSNNEKVTITGFGTFDVGKRQARRGVNPFENKPMDIPEMRIPRFKAGKALRTLVK
jgi:DNA-binding protein HU-beta